MMLIETVVILYMFWLNHTRNVYSSELPALARTPGTVPAPPLCEVSCIGLVYSIVVLAQLSTIKCDTTGTRALLAIIAAVVLQGALCTVGRRFCRQSRASHDSHGDHGSRS